MRETGFDKLLRLGIGLLMVTLVYVIYDAMHEHPAIISGDDAPAFTITVDNGRTVSIPNFEGKLLVLNFWATWCKGCVEESASLSEFTRYFSDKGVVVLALSLDKDKTIYQDFLNRTKPVFLTARDFEIHAEYGTFELPETYIISSRGKVLEKIIGAVDWTEPALISRVSSFL